MKRKMDEHLEFTGYKAGLVAKDYYRRDGTNYDETFVRVILFDVRLLVVVHYVALG